MFWVSYIDDYLVGGPKEEVEAVIAEFTTRFTCTREGFQEHIGCKMDYNQVKRELKITQPVMIQTLKDEFELDSIPEAAARGYTTPASPGSTLQVVEAEFHVPPHRQSYLRKGNGTLLWIARKSRPECLNAVREIGQCAGRACEAHIKQMHRIMQYIVNTEKRGVMIRPKQHINGTEIFDFKFQVTGGSDSDYATNAETRRSVSGYGVELNGVVVVRQCKNQNMVTLSSCEAEIVAYAAAAKEILFVQQIIESMGLHVQYPMTADIDNNGGRYLINNWSTGGRTKHMAVRLYWLRELKQNGILEPRYKSTDSNHWDLFTKNLGQDAFDRHVAYFCGEDDPYIWTVVKKKPRKTSGVPGARKEDVGMISARETTVRKDTVKLGVRKLQDEEDRTES